MIYTDSRYADGLVFSSYKPATQDYHVTVFRTFPTDSSTYALYQWRDDDRIDDLAAKFMGDASLWWRIMDFNPELLNPMDIPAGTVLRMPNGK